MNLSDIKKRALADISAAVDAKTLEKIRVQYLGRKGELTKVLRSLSKKSLAEKKRLGKAANELKKVIDEKLSQQLNKLVADKQSATAIDLTLPGKKIKPGHLHPLTLAERKIEEIFHGLNFSVVTGPEIETEHYNFDALNIPPDHPAREMWDTLWLRQSSRDQKLEAGSRKLMRTHTSPVQVRYMQEHQPPFQIIVPGRVFRYEATDASHEINFYQFEGLMIGKDISLANFKYIASEFFQKFFDKKVPVRFRPSYFPFTEPSVEVDIRWKGQWLEVMGAGMVHPKVLAAGGYNPKNWQGFAFGGGVDRLAMIKYGINDIRLFYNGDLRFIHQF